jgi:hypothetical protein
MTSRLPKLEYPITELEQKDLLYILAALRKLRDETGYGEVTLSVIDKKVRYLNTNIRYKPDDSEVG